MHSNAIRKRRLELGWYIHVGGNSSRDNLSLRKLSLHRTLKQTINLCALRMLVAGVTTNSRQLAAGSNYCPKRMKFAMSLNHLLGKSSAVIQKLLKLMGVY